LLIYCLSHEYMDNASNTPQIKAAISIAKWFPKNQFGELMSINSVYQRIAGTANEVGQYTLKLALEGRLDRCLIENQVKLARLCSQWSGETVTTNELIVVDE